MLFSINVYSSELLLDEDEPKSPNNHAYQPLETNQFEQNSTRSIALFSTTEDDFYVDESERTVVARRKYPLSPVYFEADSVIGQILNILDDDAIEDKLKSIEETLAELKQTKNQMVKQLGKNKFLNNIPEKILKSTKIKSVIEDATEREKKELRLITRIEQITGEDATGVKEKIDRIKEILQGTQWDNLDAFGQETDQRTFKGLSKKAIGAGFFSTLFGATVPFAVCGSTIYYIGDFLQLPISGLGSNLLISWIVTTTAPPFVQQSFNTGQKITSRIFHEDSFPDNVGKADSVPGVFKKNKAHYSVKAFFMVSAAINALIPTLLLRDAEADFPLFFAFTACPFYFAWLENYYSVGSLNIDHSFERYYYGTRSNSLKKEILIKKLQDFKLAIGQNDKLACDIFKIVKDQKKKEFSNKKGNSFAFSCFFIRNALRIEGEREAFAENFKLDMEEHEYSLKDDLAEWFSTFVTGLGSYGKYCITQSVLQGLIMEFGLSGQNAEIISSSIALFETLYRIGASNYTQQNYFKDFKNILSSGSNFTIIRKASSFSSCVNGALLSLPNLVTGMKVFGNYSLTSQIVTLAPAFLMDLSYYQQFFGKKNDEVVTNISGNLSRVVRNKGAVLKRASLIYDADKVEKLIEQADVETIEKLYTILMLGR